MLAIITPSLVFFSIYFFLQNMTDVFSIYPSLKENTKIPFYVFLAVFIATYLTTVYVDLLRRSVYYRPSEGFLRRNFEKIILALIAGLIGAGIKALFD